MPWRCDAGHTWQVLIANRVKGSRCPVCINQQVLAGFNDLATTHPELAAQADGWDPTTVVAGSSKRLAWRCAKGHRWENTVVKRTRGRGCPICANQQVLAGYNDLATTHPELAAQADGWDPASAIVGSNKRLTWCCGDGHRWEAAVASRIAGRGCPYCSGRRAIAGKTDLATTHPDLAKEADGWDPRTVSAGSNKRLTWRCRKGHTWQTTVDQRASRGSGCPVCCNRQVLAGFNDLVTTHPELAAEAEGWEPSTVTAGMATLCFWRCPDGHIFEARVYSRTSGSGCPVCSNKRVVPGLNDLATTHPHLAAQADGWDPATVTAGSNSAKPWLCPLGHRWGAVVASRAGAGCGCPVCSNKQLLTGFNDLATLHPDFAAQADGWDPSTVLAGSHSRRTWCCDAGHTWEAQVKSRTGSGSGCPVCNGGGFDPSRPGLLYVVESEEHDFYKVGIANTPGRRRIAQHARTWGAKLRWSHVASGDVIQCAETTVLRWKRSLGLHDGVESGDGYTETVARSLVGLEELVGVCHEALELARRDGA